MDDATEVARVVTVALLMACGGAIGLLVRPRLFDELFEALGAEPGGSV